MIEREAISYKGNKEMKVDEFIQRIQRGIDGRVKFILETIDNFVENIKTFGLLIEVNWFMVWVWTYLC